MLSVFPPHITPERFLTASVPGIGGTLKQEPEDFLVEELPAYEPCGEGEHLYLFIQKRGMATDHLARLLADHFGVRRDAIGVAGLKDKRAVTTQLFSVHLPGRKDADVRSFENPHATVLWAARHTNKLRRGHLKGNRFVIRVRNVSASKAVFAQRALRMLVAQGAPNRIGEQRFGILRRNHLIGRAIVLGDVEEILQLLLGPSDEFPHVQERAREAYAAGSYEDAMALLPPASRVERRALSILARDGDKRRAAYSIDPLARSFFVTAFQSAIFNSVLDRRIAEDTYDRLIEGDLAFKHDSGAAFGVTASVLADEGVTDPAKSLICRLQQLEISPSGPMWGPEMTRAAGSVGNMELEELLKTGVTLEHLEAFWSRCRDAMVGQRRALRVPVTYPDVEGGMDERGEYVKLRFELPRGSFATTVMQEIMKIDLPEDDETPDEGGAARSNEQR
jgi:tRNA pseudouridine13 synthase